MTAIELPLPPALQKGPRTLIVDPKGDTSEVIDVFVGHDSVELDIPMPELPRAARDAFPILFKTVARAAFDLAPDELTSEQNDELDWVVAEMVLANPATTLESDNAVFSKGYVIREVALEQDDEIWDGRAIVDLAQASAESPRRHQPVYWNVDHGRYYKDPARGADTPWNEWPLPRLQTERSLHAARHGSGNPRLVRPGVSSEFWRGYMWMFAKNWAFRATSHRFLGGDLMPRGGFRGFFPWPDKSKSLDELMERDAFKKNESIAMREPEIANSDAWLVDRILNGIHPCLFERGGVANRYVANQYRVSFNWNHLELGAVEDRGHIAPPDSELDKKHYELPNAVATLEKVGDELVLRSIELQHRKRFVPGTDSEPLHGPVSDSELEDVEPYTPDHTNEAAWEYAKRAFRCQLAMAGESDVHLASHLLTEQFMAALVSTPGMARTKAREPGHPVWEILWPHLREVERINAFGDILIMGDTGILANATALTPKACRERLLEQLGRRDWKGFAPREALCPSHRYAHAANAFWTAIQSFVRAAVQDEWGEIDATWDVCKTFADTLERRSPRHRPYRGLTTKQAWDEGSHSELSFKTVGGPSMSTLPDRSASATERRDLLVQLCAYAIYHATFVHTWSNDRQFDDLGDPRHTSLGLMTRRAPCAGDDMEEWEREARPLLRDAGFTATLARILSHLHVGMLLADDDCDVWNHPKPGKSPVDGRFRDAVRAVRSAYESGDDPHHEVRSILDRANVCNLRSHINT